MPDPATGGPSVGEALSVRALGRKARRHQISGHALLGMALALAVLAAVLLLWAGITMGVLRGVLLAIAAIVMPLRLMASRLAGVTLADGVTAKSNSALRRWLSHWEAAGLLLASGLCAFGSGHDMGVIMGLVCAALLLLGGVRGPTIGPSYLFGLYPSLLLTAGALASIFEPIWGWRGQTFLATLIVIAAVLTVQVLRRRPQQGAAPSQPGQDA